MGFGKQSDIFLKYLVPLAFCKACARLQATKAATKGQQTIKASAASGSKIHNSTKEENTYFSLTISSSIQMIFKSFGNWKMQ